MDYFYLLIALAVGIFIGNRWATWLYTGVILILMRDLKVTEEDLRNMAKNNGVELPDSATTNEPVLVEIGMRVEKENGQLYAYRTDTNQFLGQAADTAALIARIALDYRDVKFRIEKDDGAEFMKE